jgi:hypothetical protein
MAMVLARYSLISSNPEHSKFLPVSRLGLMAIAVSTLCAIAMFLILVLGEQNSPLLPERSLSPSAAASANSRAPAISPPNDPPDPPPPQPRRYLQFSLTRSNHFQHLGPVGIQVQRIDSKRGYYDIALLVKGRRLNKRHLRVNEPVLITVNKSEPPSEFMVNDIGKDRISGYVSSPRSEHTKAAR